MKILVYTTNMAITSEEKKVKEGEIERDAFVVTFTNGTLEQLEELRQYFKSNDKLELVKLGISVLQKAKETKENS